MPAPSQAQKTPPSSGGTPKNSSRPGGKKPPSEMVAEEQGRRRAEETEAATSYLSEAYGVPEEAQEEATSAVRGYMDQYGMTREQAADLVNLEYISETGRDLGGGEGYGAQDLRESTRRAETYLGGLGSAARGQTAGATQQTAQRLQGMLGVGRTAGLAQISKERRRAAGAAAQQAKILGSVQKAQLDRIKAQEQSITQSIFGSLLGGAVGLGVAALLGPSAGMTAKALLVSGSSKLGGDIGGSI